MAQAAPVFVHGCWRSASTWFWAKLRGRPRLRCYYEPLHERFAWHTLEVIRSQRISPEGLRKAGHPPIERPYFAEFEDVLAAGDLGFDPGQPYERYFLRPEETDDPLERCRIQCQIGTSVSEATFRLWMLDSGQSCLSHHIGRAEFGAIHSHHWCHFRAVFVSVPRDPSHL